MDEIRPAKYLRLVWQNNDPSDLSTTYYVQSVIRRSDTGATLETVNLDAGTGGRYTGRYLIPNLPADTTIDTTITIYTDSGYTTRSQIKAVENREYIIRNERKPAGVVMGNVSGANPFEIRKIIKEELNKLKLPEYKETDLSKVFTKLDTAISKFDKIPQTDLMPLKDDLRAISVTLSKKIDNIPQPDLKPIQDNIGELASEVSQTRESYNNEKDDRNSFVEEIKSLIEKMKTFFFDDVEDLKNEVSTGKEEIIKEVRKSNNLSYTMDFSPKNNQKEDENTE